MWLSLMASNGCLRKVLDLGDIGPCCLCRWKQWFLYYSYHELRKGNPGSLLGMVLIVLIGVGVNLISMVRVAAVCMPWCPKPTGRLTACSCQRACIPKSRFLEDSWHVPTILQDSSSLLKSLSRKTSKKQFSKLFGFSEWNQGKHGKALHRKLAFWGLRSRREHVTICIACTIP